MSADASPVSTMSPSSEEFTRLVSDPRTRAAVRQLLEHLDTIAFCAQALDELFRRGDVIADNVAEAVAEVRTEAGPDSQVTEFLEEVPRLARTGRRLAETASHADLESVATSGIVERLTDPATLNTLNRLLDFLPLIALVVEALDEFIRRGDTIADSVAESVNDLRNGGTQVDLAALRRLAEVLPQIVETGAEWIDSGVLDQGLPKVVEAGMGMIDAGMLDQEVVRTLGELGKAAVDSFHEAREGSFQPVGLWGLLRAMKDPEIQKLIGFGLTVAKAFSRKVL